MQRRATLLLVTIFLINTALLLEISSPRASLRGIHVQGNKLVNSAGVEVRLRGVDRSGSEFACIGGYGFFDGPTDQASINAIKSWNVNIVRLPLNEDCWLNINDVKPEYGGANYQNAIAGFVKLLNANDIIVILDLHWTAPGNERATKQVPMPDMDHSPTFWKEVAESYKSNDMVFFDLFNEPYPGNGAWDGADNWSCWKNGTNCVGISYPVAGMQQLVDAVRSTGAKNVITLGGLQWSDSLGDWWEYKPHDPEGQTIPSWHTYNFNHCTNQDCWTSTIAPLAEKVPIIATEIGENDCAGNYITPLMNFMDSKGIHYLAWTWNTWDCNTGPALITDYNGTPTNFGAAYKSHLTSA